MIDAGDFCPTNKREWDQVKAALLEEVGWKCGYCDCDLVWTTATIDHLIPRCQDGSDHFANLGIACQRCNSRKNGRSIAQWRGDLPRALNA